MDSSITTILDGIKASAVTLVPILYSLVVAALLDLATGLLAAWRSGTLDPTYIPEFIKSHIVGKISPIMLTLLASIAVGGTDSAAGLALSVLGGTAAAAYLAGVVGSITENLGDISSKSKGLPSSVQPPPSA